MKEWAPSQAILAIIYAFIAPIFNPAKVFIKTSLLQFPSDLKLLPVSPIKLAENTVKLRAFNY